MEAEIDEKDDDDEPEDSRESKIKTRRATMQEIEYMIQFAAYSHSSNLWQQLNVPKRFKKA